MGVVDEVKSRLDIVDVVSRYVSLQRGGRAFKALCPFHSEKTPSFYVFPERQTWRCFGACATGGDLFAFVMKVENVGFSDALKRLAEWAGVDIPRATRSQEGDTLHQINEAAREFFSRRLASSEGAQAREYLEGRGLSRETIEAFQLGLSPRDGRSLVGFLSSKGYSPEQQALAGLATRDERGGFRDMFRNRLMVPIRDSLGRLAGFGGRALDDATPKYLNTPRTPVFDKGRLLYAFHRAREAILNGTAVVVEGYMDAIMAHQHGFTNVVASMGTALTEHQVALLKGAAREVVLALDPDAAGHEATYRSLESSWRVFQRRVVAQARGTALYERPQMPTLKVAPLPQGKDPDEIIREEPAQWQRLIDSAVPLMEYLFDVMASRYDVSTAQGKARVAELLYPLVAAVEEPYQQDGYFQRLARLLGVSERTLEASLGRPRAQRPARAASRAATPTPFATLEHDPLEEYPLTLLLKFPELAQHATMLRPEHFRRIENREIFTHWLKNVNIRGVDDLEPDLRQHLDYLLSKETPPLEFKARERALVEAVFRLEERRLRELKLEEELRLAQASSEELYTQKERILETNERIRQVFLQRAEQKK